MPSLTSLPIPLLEMILVDLCDEDLHIFRSSLQGTTTSLRSLSYPHVYHTLDYADAAHASLPEALLAPALASPVLAAAAVNLLGNRLTFLTFINTEGRLPLWIHAFARHVKAVSAGIVAEKWHPGLPHDLRVLRLNKACESTVDMFKEITVNHVRLQVLDLVHVPFDEFGTMQDEVMAGLCATLESSHTTLRELALPVYAKSDPCACALETVTLPHLEVFSVELMNVRDPTNVSDRRQERLGRSFLRMMQAVDGHADRSYGLTTLGELRLINLYKVPCTAIRDSRCSAGLFRAVRVLRAGMSESIQVMNSKAEELEFFSLFRKLECLYWNGNPRSISTSFAFRDLCEKLREVHLCHRTWIAGAQVGVDTSKFHPFFWGHPVRLLSIVRMSSKKLMTFVSYDRLDTDDLRGIGKYCSNLRHLSLHVTSENLPELRGLIKACERLIGVEVVVLERYVGGLDRQDWLELARAIPRYHANLRDVAIKALRASRDIATPVDAMIDCFVDVVKRFGSRARRLVFLAETQSVSIANLVNAVSRILSTCGDHALGLTYLKIDIVAREGRLKFDLNAILHAVWNLRATKESLVIRSHRLETLDLGRWHHLSIPRRIVYHGTLYPAEGWG